MGGSLLGGGPINLVLLGFPPWVPLGGARYTGSGSN